MLARASRTSFETARRSAIAALGDLRVDTGRYACPSELRRALRETGTRSSPEPLALDMAGECASTLPSNAGPIGGAPDFMKVLRLPFGTS